MGTKQGRFLLTCKVYFLALLVVAGLWALAGPASAASQTRSVALASCAAGGVDVDLVAKGTVEDVVASQTSSRIEVRVDQVLLGDRGYSGRTLYIRTDSGTDQVNSEDLSFREGARYALYLQRQGNEWKTNVCLGTHELTVSPQAATKAPEAETSPGSPTMPETGGPGVLVLFAACVGLLLSGIGACMWRRAR